MSFILDALKKSEAERQRQAGPTLLEVRIARPQRRYPVWAAIVGVLLGVNAVVLVVFLLHRPAALSPGRAPEPPVPAAAAQSQTAGQAGSAAAAAARSTPVAPATAGGTGAASGAASGAAALPSSPSTAPPAGTIGATTVGNASPGVSEAPNPADYEPAVAAGGARVERANAVNYANLPSIGQISGNVPTLRLDLLDYSDRPNERYALINMRRVREGDVLPEGPRVLAITREGVALDYQGQDFMLRTAAQ